MPKSLKHVIEPLEDRLLFTAWYVSATGGLDSYPGSLAQPFATIQRAAAIAQPGDTVFIRGGTYRETVTPANSGTAGAPITYTNYNHEQVTIDGANPITGWVPYNGAIYKATQPWDLGDGNNQVFDGGQMLTDARWPNSGLDPMHPTVEIAPKITSTGQAGANGLCTATITDPALTQAAGYWVGATIHISPQQGWIWQSGTVTASSPGSLTYTYLLLNTNQVPASGDPYYLSGKFQALDYPGEFYHDPTTNTLYAWMPDSTAPTNVESKVRQYGFVIADKSYINVQNLHFFATSLLTTANASNVSLSHLTFAFVSQQMDEPEPWIVKNSGPTTGVILFGTNITISNSQVFYSSGNGIFVGGSNNTIQNCTIAEIDYAVGDEAAILIIGGSNITASHNTIYDTARSGINFFSAPHTLILNNLIHDIGLRVSDAGGIYTWHTNGQGAEIADNIIYNAYGAGYGNTDIFLDNITVNIIVDHNICYNADAALKMNALSMDDQVYNNTLVANANPHPFAKTLFGKPAALVEGASPTMPGTIIENNIMVGTVMYSTGATQSHNINPLLANAKFVDPANGNYQLAAGSPAIDVGAVIPPYTNGFIGKAPDDGALELGGAVFSTGVPVAPTPATNVIAAQNYTGQKGVTVQPPGIGSCDAGDWVLYSNLDFGSGVHSFSASLAVIASFAGKYIDIHIDSVGGPIIGTLQTTSTGSWTTFTTQTTAVSPVTGVHDVYLVFRGGYGVCNLNTLQFNP